MEEPAVELPLLDGPGISGPSIEAKPWCTGKQLPLGFNTRWSTERNYE